MSVVPYKIIRDSTIKEDSALEDSLYRITKEQVVIRNIRWCRNSSETKAVLIRENPAILSALSSLAIYTFLVNLFKLWPDIRQDILHYSTIPFIGSGAVGFGIGMHSILHPDERKARFFSHFKRVWNSLLTATGGAFTASMTIVIQWDLEFHPDDGNVSDTKFFTQIFPFPAIVGTLCFVWNAISPAQKRFWFGENSRLAKVIDTFSRFLLFGSIFQAVFLPIPISKFLTFILGSSASLGVVTAQNIAPRHQKKIQTFMILLAMGGMIYLSEKSLRSEDPYEHKKYSTSDLWWFYLKIAFFSATTTIGSIITLFRAREYVAEKVTQDILVPVGNPENLRTQARNQFLAEIFQSRERFLEFKKIIQENSEFRKRILELYTSDTDMIAQLLEGAPNEMKVVPLSPKSASSHTRIAIQPPDSSEQPSSGVSSVASSPRADATSFEPIRTQTDAMTPAYNALRENTKEAQRLASGIAPSAGRCVIL